MKRIRDVVGIVCAVLVVVTLLTAPLNAIAVQLGNNDAGSAHALLAERSSAGEMKEKREGIGEIAPASDDGCSSGYWCCENVDRGKFCAPCGSKPCIMDQATVCSWFGANPTDGC